ncbi:Na(+)/H(+) antiporter subunit D [Gammaproteobacteria bacterium]|nr:Na(+)/H(+) antiporter subunit D [Gammaproteobacteria bacterium]
MLQGLNPAYILIVGGLLTALLPQRTRSLAMVVIPALGLLQLLSLPFGDYGQVQIFDLQLVTLRLDALAFSWALLFHIAALLAAIYSLHVRDRLQDMSFLVYAGAAVGAVLAGDLLTLFVYWELTAVASAFLIWASRTPAATASAMRYLLAQIFSGLLLLVGTVMWTRAGGSLRFDALSLETTAGWLILIGFGIKAGFPLLHAWMKDAYPEATVTGSVILAAFTTKMAIYALARGYAGESLLITVGVVMALFPIVFAILENDLRRTLVYSLNSQLGLMVVAIGIGGDKGIAAAAALAFASVLYKSLMMMGMGAVLYRTGTVRADRLGGLWSAMPLTMFFMLIGSLTIAATPFLVAFAGKSMLLSAIGGKGDLIVWLLLLTASIATMLHSAIKVPYIAFFGELRDPSLHARLDDQRNAGGDGIPSNMIVAMALGAGLCLLFGLFPSLLYRLLPSVPDYDAYTAGHILSQLQLLAFVVFAFFLMQRFSLWPMPRAGQLRDVDWLYRVVLPTLMRPLIGFARWLWLELAELGKVVAASSTTTSLRFFGPGSLLTRTLPANLIVVVALTILLLSLAAVLLL